MINFHYKPVGRACNQHEKVHGVACGSAGLETWRLVATSFDSSKLALRISHNRWHECSQQRLGTQSTNHRLVFIDMNLAHNLFITDIFCSCVLRAETSAFVFVY